MGEKGEWSKNYGKKDDRKYGKKDHRKYDKKDNRKSGRKDGEEKPKDTESNGKRKRIIWIKRIIFLTMVVLLSEKVIPDYLKNRGREKEERQAAEGMQLCMAVSALYREKTKNRRNMENRENGEGSDDEYVLDLVTDIYWKDIGDTSHPLYDHCPSTWKAGGKITGMVINESGELLEITYEGPDKKEEIWRMRQKDGELMVEVLEN